MVFKRFSSEGLDLADIKKVIKENSYTRGNEGYILRDASGHAIAADYVFRFPTFVDVFDEKKLEFTKEKISRIALVRFSLDYSFRLLTIFSKSSAVYRLITDLGKITDFRMSVDDVTFNPNQIIRKFKKASYDLNINSIRIKNFSYDEDIIGTYAAKVKTQQVVKRLLEDHSGDVSYISGYLELDDKRITLGFFQNGSLRIYGDPEDLPEMVEDIPHILFEGEA